MYGKENPSLHELFKPCLLDNHPDSVCKRKPYGVDYISTCTVNQNIFNTKLLFDFDADDSMS